MEYIVTHGKRNTFIKNLVRDLKGNTLVLFNYVEKHGEPLFDLINKNIGDTKKVFFVHGGVEASEREEIRRLAEVNDNCVIIASYGTFSTGINIKNLHNIIFASPSKSRIRNLQSIGRVLRKGDNKGFKQCFMTLLMIFLEGVILTIHSITSKNESKFITKSNLIMKLSQ